MCVQQAEGLPETVFLKRSATKRVPTILHKRPMGASPDRFNFGAEKTDEPRSPRLRSTLGLRDHAKSFVTGEAFTNSRG